MSGAETLGGSGGVEAPGAYPRPGASGRVPPPPRTCRARALPPSAGPYLAWRVLAARPGTARPRERGRRNGGGGGSSGGGRGGAGAADRLGPGSEGGEARRRGDAAAREGAEAGAGGRARGGAQAPPPLPPPLPAASSSPPDSRSDSSSPTSHSLPFALPFLHLPPLLLSLCLPPAFPPSASPLWASEAAPGPGGASARSGTGSDEGSGYRPSSPPAKGPACPFWEPGLTATFRGPPRSPGSPAPPGSLASSGANLPSTNVWTDRLGSGRLLLCFLVNLTSGQNIPNRPPTFSQSAVGRYLAQSRFV